MPRSPSLIDRPARQSLIERLQWIDSGESPIQSLRDHSLQTDDDAIPEIVIHLLANGDRLPLSSRDDLNRPSPQGREEIRRAIEFLRTDMEYAPPVETRVDRFVVICLIVYLSGAIIEIISQDRLILPVANPIRFITIAAGAVLFLRLFIAYFAALAIAARHIFYVRVLKREVSDTKTNDLWPFVSQEQLRQMQSLKLTESALL